MSTSHKLTIAVTNGLFFCLVVFSTVGAVNLSDFRVNEENFPGTFDQQGVSMDHNAQGGFVVTWMDWRSGVPLPYCQLFNPSGEPVGNNRLVDSASVLTWGNWLAVAPGVAMNSTGVFVVLVPTNRSDMYYHVAAWFFDADGNLTQGPIQISGPESGGDGTKPWGAAVDFNDRGHIVAVWADDEAGILWGQYLDPSGNKIGANFRIAEGASHQHLWDLHPIDVILTPEDKIFVTDQAGGWRTEQVFVWYFEYGDTNATEILIDQTPQLEPDTLYPDTFYTVSWPRSAYNSSGFFTSLWVRTILLQITENGYHQLGFEVWSTVVDTTGAVASGPQLLIDSSTAKLQSVWAVAAAATDDGFAYLALQWMGTGDTLISVQPFNTAGSPTGPSYTLEHGPESKLFSALSAFQPRANELVVGWQGNGIDNRPNVLVQGFTTGGSPTFEGIRVHDDIGAIQTAPVIAADMNGAVLYLWIDYRTGLRGSVYGQVVAADGTPVGDNFLVSEQTGYWISQLRVGGNGADRAVAVWTAYNNAPYDPEKVFAQVFDYPNFSKVGSNLLVSDAAHNSSEFMADAVVLDDKSFVIGYRGTTVDSWNERPYNCYVRKYGSNLTPLTSWIKVNESDSPEFNDWVYDADMVPALCYGANGRIGVAWIENSTRHPMLQFFDGNLTKIGVNIEVHSGNRESIRPALAYNDDGTWLVAWNRASGTYGGLWMRGFDNDGAPLWNVVQVSKYITAPNLIAGPDDNFLLCFEIPAVGSVPWEYDDYNIWARKVAHGGSFAGTMLKINTDATTANQRQPAVTYSGTAGNTVVFTWEDYRNLPGNPDIYARCLEWDKISAAPGDFNLDGSVNVVDITCLVDYLFRNGPAPLEVFTADVDGSGSVNVADVTALVNYLFR